MQTHLFRPARSGIQPCAPGAEIQTCHRGGRNPWLLFTSVCSCSSTHSGNIPHFGLTPTKLQSQLMPRLERCLPQARASFPRSSPTDHLPPPPRPVGAQPEEAW